MTKCNIYKIKEDAKEKLPAVYTFYYADDFYKDVITNKLVISMIGVDLETMQMTQLFDKFVVPSELFTEYFYEEIVMTSSEINDRIEELGLDR